MDNQNKNLFLATALSFVVILAWFWMFPPEEPQTTVDPVAATQELATADATTPSAGAVEATAAAPTDAVAIEADAPRVAIETPELSGSISLLGGRLDDIYLSQYRLTLDDDAETVRLLRPVGEEDAYYASFGWAAAAIQASATDTGCRALMLAAAASNGSDASIHCSGKALSCS